MQCATMNRRTLTMNWDGLGDEDDDDQFFESRQRISAVVPLDLDSDDEDFEDSRMSFASTATHRKISSPSIKNPEPPSAKPTSVMASYDMWMSEPGDISERRKRLLQGMGLSSSKDMLRIASTKVTKALSKKIENDQVTTQKPVKNKKESSVDKDNQQQQQHIQALSPNVPNVLVRSRSDSDIDVFFSAKTKQRKEDLLGSVSKQRLTRALSGPQISTTGTHQYSTDIRTSPNLVKNKFSSSQRNEGVIPDDGFSSFFIIKNLDTGKEFVVKECNEQGMWNKLSDVQTGKQLTMEEFEMSVGYSPVVKELMRRQNRNDGRKLNTKSFTKSFRNSKKKGAAILKNIKGVASSKSMSHKDHEQSSNSSPEEQKAGKATSQWVKARQHGKTYKEFTALHLSQEIQAHEGSIWTIRFSQDARYLASAGEDKVIHVWEVIDCDVMSTKSGDDLSSASSTPVHPMAGIGSERPPITPLLSEKKKKGKTNKKKGSTIPDYVNMPEVIFALSEKPVCTFNGHQDDVLDLSWSKSQLLLSSSMDKTVRLWDLEKKICLKMFAHNDYVTCIHFNPVDDDYFISGSLDGKVRIWNASLRHVVDWMDIHEMVTAASYTPDGQGAVIGSHHGVCRFYSIDDCKLEHVNDVQMKVKSQMKKLPGFQNQPQLKKITGFQYTPWNPSEVLITSTDSRIRIYDGPELIQKYRGFKNTGSQISAFFSPDGKHVISASEDSQVYIWKVDEAKNPTTTGARSKTKTTVQSYEHFQCKDVSVAIPWPGSIKGEPPTIEIHSKRHSKRHTAVVSQQEDNNTSPVGQSKNLPPLPKKNRNDSYADEDLVISSPKEIGVGESFGSSASSNGASICLDESPSISASSTASSIRLGDSPSISASASGGRDCIQATAWGVVIVTASLEGELRVYQNFGLPLKVGRQGNLF